MHQRLKDHSILACPDCDQLHRRCALPLRGRACCSRCGATLYRHRVNPRGRTLALALAGLILFVPANLAPVMTFHFSGRAQDNVLFDGPWALWEGGLRGIALLVFWTSMLAPLLHLGGLTGLLWPGGRCEAGWWKRGLFKMLGWLDEWAMLDVYLLGLVVCAVKLGAIGRITTGTGLYLLVTAMLLSLATGLSFDAQAFWRQQGRAKP